MRSSKKKSLRSQSSQLSMKPKTQYSKTEKEIEIILDEYCKDLDDDTGQIGINPLPAPAFIHFEACNVETPRINFGPAMASVVKKKLKVMMSKNKDD